MNLKAIHHILVGTRYATCGESLHEIIANKDFWHTDESLFVDTYIIKELLEPLSTRKPPLPDYMAGMLCPYCIRRCSTKRRDKAEKLRREKLNKLEGCECKDS